MSLAIEQAHLAAAQDEVPVGAVLVQNNTLVGSGFNQTITLSDPTAHAEIMAMRAAAKTLNNYRLPECKLYVTLEPCLMCVGAIFHARIQTIVFGASDPKTGACGSVIDAFTLDKLNHHGVCYGGVLQDQCGALLSNFFAAKRAAARQKREE